MDESKAYVMKHRGHRPTRAERPTFSRGSEHDRIKTYRQIWARQEKRVNDVVREFHQHTIYSVCSFVERRVKLRPITSLPTALVVTGAQTASQEHIFETIEDEVGSKQGNVFVSLASPDGPNLKTLLRAIIKQATSNESDARDDEHVSIARGSGIRLLPYDLRILQEYSIARKLRKIVVLFKHVEAFDVTVLGETIELLSSWRDRIPLVCIFGVATSIENLEDKLPQSTLKCCSGEAFYAADSRDVIEKIFWTLNDDHAVLRLGPKAAESIIARQREQGQDTRAFIRSLQYCYMSHFFGNELSALLAIDKDLTKLATDHASAIRSLPSFQGHIEVLIDAGEVNKARDLMQSNVALSEEVVQGLEAGQASITWSLGAIHIFERLTACLEIQHRSTRSTLFIKALSGELRDSAQLRELLLFVRRAASDKLEKMLPMVFDILMTMPPGDNTTSPDDFSDLLDQLSNLLNSTNIHDGAPLRSDHDMKEEIYRTTVVAQKVELSRQKAELSKSDAIYSQLLIAFHDLLLGLFKETLQPASNLFLNEILFYDLKSSVRDSFAPRTRAAIERALSRPHDYLGCACCSSAEGTLGCSQPRTSIVYQLILESGPLVNAYDLWSAYQALIGEDQCDEQIKVSVFLRAIAELKRIGILKPSRKKDDHVAKIAWRGL